MANNLGILANKYYFKFQNFKTWNVLEYKIQVFKGEACIPLSLFKGSQLTNSAINKISTLLCRLSGLRGSSLLTPRHTKKIIDLGNCAAPSNSVIQALDNQKLFE